MPNIVGQKKWSIVRLLEHHELARGGLNGNMNEQAQALADRTELLMEEKASKSEIGNGWHEFDTYVLFDAAKATLPLNCTVVIGEKNTTGTGQWDIGNNSWNGTTLKKSAFDPVEISKSYINNKFAIPLDQISDFTIENTKGVLSTDFTTINSAASLSISDGKAIITASTTTDFVRSVFTSRQIVDDKKRVLKLKFNTNDVSSVTGAAIFIAENIGIIYYSNGALAVVNKSFQTQSSQSITDTNLAYSANESVDLELQLNGDGTGIAIAKKSNGYFRNLNFSGMQKGKVYLASRRLIATKTFTFESFSINEKNITQQELSKALLKSENTGFDQTIDGFFSSVNDEKSTLYKFSISDSKLLLDTTSATSNAVFYAKTGVNYLSAAEFELSSKILTGAVTAGMALVVGDGTSRKIFAYLKNGLIGTLKSDGSLDIGSVDASMAYTNEQIAKMRVSVSSDGDAVLTALHPNGRTATFKMVGVVAGNVYPAWRGSSTIAELHYLNKIIVSPNSVKLVSKVEQLAQQSKFPQTWRVLPDSEVGRAVKGFTCTGLAKITAGNFRECWAVGDDGRLTENITSDFKPRIHILDGAFNRILLTIDPGYTGASLQGVTYDTLSNYNIWAACSANGTIRKFSVQLDTASQEVVADRITVASLGISLVPNAIAFDANKGTGKGAIWVGDSSGLNVYLIDCDPAAATRVIKTITLANNPDQFQLLGNVLLYQSGGNGSRASIYAYDLVTDIEYAKWTQLECLFAAEGFYYDQTWRTLYAVNDGGYHNSYASGPRFNCVFEYKLDY